MTTEETLQQAMARLEEEAILYHDQAWYEEQVAKVREQFAEKEERKKREKREHRYKLQKFFENVSKELMRAPQGPKKFVYLELLGFKEPVYRQEKKTLQEAIQEVRIDLQERLETAKGLRSAEPVRVDRQRKRFSPEEWDGLTDRERFRYRCDRDIWDDLRRTVCSYHSWSGGYSSGYSTGYGTSGNYHSAGSATTCHVPETDSFAELQQSAVQFCEKALAFLQQIQQEIEYQTVALN